MKRMYFVLQHLVSQKLTSSKTMAQRKTDLFSAADVRIAELAKALAHPARVAILNVLAERNECICGEIVEELPLAQATVSQHLKELKDAGLITSAIDGPRTCYCLNPAALQELQSLFAQFSGSLCACCGQPADATVVVVPTIHQIGNKACC
jgi:DNA-binding transcriptional ArsR family regulator